jgi:tRNA dimethylallyltransferase
MNHDATSLPIICLMGPTASGKTSLAIELVKRFPCEIISVDSAMIYRHMDIGTAKPTKDILQIAPHRLIDIIDPKDIYSAGQFRLHALDEMEKISAQKKIPLLVGGTMLYFRVLQQGIAKLPPANMKLRIELKSRAQKEGWPSLHSFLAEVDPIAAKRINASDSQRIQRALEVYLLTGQPISAVQKETVPLSGYSFHNLVIAPNDRSYLHECIRRRFDHMLALGLIDEVTSLYERGDLHADLPAIRSVGYREVWAYLAQVLSYKEMYEQAISASRQLAKRQLTWLRSWPNAICLDSNSSDNFDQAQRVMENIVKKQALWN